MELVLNLPLVCQRPPSPSTQPVPKNINRTPTFKHLNVTPASQNVHRVSRSKDFSRNSRSRDLGRNLRSKDFERNPRCKYLRRSFGLSLSTASDLNRSFHGLSFSTASDLNRSFHVLSFLNAFHGGELSRALLKPQTLKMTDSQRLQERPVHVFATAAPLSTPAIPSNESVSEIEEPVNQIPAGENEDEQEKFVWSEHWYPVSLVEDLDPSMPTKFQLLGQELVLWRDAEGTWRAFADKCPHRLAPLSEGRIDENGWLQCSYHGWSFKGDGSCGRIPQAAAVGPEAKAIYSPKACAVAFPTLVSQGLLFVWPDDKGWDRALQTKPPMLPYPFSSANYSTVTIQRDLYYGYDTLMENVSDPSHIDFAHHKVTGRRDRAKPLQFQVQSSGPWGFTGSNSDTPKITSEFYAPCYFINKIEIPVSLPILGQKVWEVWICSFNIPMAPGQTRSIVCSARNFFRFLMPGPAWWQLVPRWHEHWTSNKVYDGDMIVLQGQEKLFLASTHDKGTSINKQYGKLTFTPTQADRFVLAFRNWLRRHGNDQPQWAFGTTIGRPLPSTVLSRRQMLDRYEQHTVNCSSCRQALSSFRTLKAVALGTAVVLLATTGVPVEMWAKITLGVSSALSCLGCYFINEAEKNFIFKDYVHAKID